MCCGAGHVRGTDRYRAVLQDCMLWCGAGHVRGTDRYRAVLQDCVLWCGAGLYVVMWCRACQRYRQVQGCGAGLYVMLWCRAVCCAVVQGMSKEWNSLTALVTHHTVMRELLPCLLVLPSSNAYSHNGLEQQQRAKLQC